MLIVIDGVRPNEWKHFVKKVLAGTEASVTLTATSPIHIKDRSILHSL